MGLNQADFAARIGVSYAAVQKWEQGKSQPRPRIKLRILELAGPEFQRSMGIAPARLRAESQADAGARLGRLETLVDELTRRIARLESVAYDRKQRGRTA